jgi:hypothetical protein
MTSPRVIEPLSHSMTEPTEGLLRRPQGSGATSTNVAGGAGFEQATAGQVVFQGGAKDLAAARGVSGRVLQGRWAESLFSVDVRLRGSCGVWEGDSNGCSAKGVPLSAWQHASAPETPAMTSTGISWSPWRPAEVLSARARLWV